jgi:hypothetical protein
MMPYHVERAGPGKWLVKKDSDGHVMGTHKTKAKAQEQIYAIEMKEQRRKK